MFNSNTTVLKAISAAVELLLGNEYIVKGRGNSGGRVSDVGRPLSDLLLLRTPAAIEDNQVFRTMHRHGESSSAALQSQDVAPGPVKTG
jgi:hypothetical protein